MLTPRPDLVAAHAALVADVRSCKRTIAQTRRELHEKKAALVALEQLPDGNLQPEEVASFASSPDQSLQRLSIDILTRHPEWTGESIQLFEEWLKDPKLDEARISALVGIVRTLRDDKSLRAMIS